MASNLAEKELVVGVAGSMLPSDGAEKELEAKRPPSSSEDSFLVRFSTSKCVGLKDWPAIKKWTVTGVLSATGCTRIMVSTIMAPALNTIAHDLRMNNTEAVMAMSVYLLATAFGPLIISPISEVYARTPILYATSIWFLIWNIVCGFSYNKGTLITARVFAGFGASAIYSLGGGVLRDVWRPE
jgi:hypothetical protein